MEKQVLDSFSYHKQQQFQTDCTLIDYSISHQDSEHKGDLQKRKKKEEKRKALENNNGLADKKAGKWDNQ